MQVSTSTLSEIQQTLRTAGWTIASVDWPADRQQAVTLHAGANGSGKAWSAALVGTLSLCQTNLPADAGIKITAMLAHPHPRSSEYHVYCAVTRPDLPSGPRFFYVGSITKGAAFSRTDLQDYLLHGLNVAIAELRRRSANLQATGISLADPLLSNADWRNPLLVQPLREVSREVVPVGARLRTAVAKITKPPAIDYAELEEAYTTMLTRTLIDHPQVKRATRRGQFLLKFGVAASKIVAEEISYSWRTTGAPRTKAVVSQLTSKAQQRWQAQLKPSLAAAHAYTRDKGSELAKSWHEVGKPKAHAALVRSQAAAARAALALKAIAAKHRPAPPQ